MKKRFVLCMLFSFCLMLCGCDAFEALNKQKAKAFSIPSYGLELTADASYSDVTDEGNFDLQITNGHLYLGVMAYRIEDINESETPQSIFGFHNKDLMSRRENVAVEIEETTEHLDKKSVAFIRWSADYNGYKNYYDSYLIEFDDSNVFAWVLVSMPPENLDIYNEKVTNIVYSLIVV